MFCKTVLSYRTTEACGRFLKRTDDANNTVTSKFTENMFRLNVFIRNMFWC